MMALSLPNITSTGPAAPAAPPGVAPAAGAFDLLLPIADPSDPRHEPAPDGKRIGKDMPVDATAAPNPLAWLTPPVSPTVSEKALPETGERNPVISDIPVSARAPVVPSATPNAPLPPQPLVSSDHPPATAPGVLPAPRTPADPTALVGSTALPSVPSVSPQVPRALHRPKEAAPIAPEVSPRLPSTVADTPLAPTPVIAPTVPAIAPDAPVATPSITRIVSRPRGGEAPAVAATLAGPALEVPSRVIATPDPAVPVAAIEPATPSITRIVSRPLGGEAPSVPATLAGPADTIPVQAVAPPGPAVQTATTTPPAAPTSEAPLLAPVIAAPVPTSNSSGAPSRETRDLPTPVSRPQPGIAIEMRPAAILQTPALITPRIAPAAQVFADAIHRAARDDRGPAIPDAASLAAASDIKTHAVAATADAQHGALDLRQEQWPARMIERIDALRDAANANDTSIRLIPDALGKIDVSLKRDGDTVAVHFTAQQAETRQLLVDAAPKLAELAEARGLKLAQNGADTAGQQQQRQQPTTPTAAAPHSARADDTESTDTRIA